MTGRDARSGPSPHQAGRHRRSRSKRTVSRMERSAIRCAGVHTRISLRSIRATASPRDQIFTVRSKRADLARDSRARSLRQRPGMMALRPRQTAAKPLSDGLRAPPPEKHHGPSRFLPHRPRRARPGQGQPDRSSAGSTAPTTANCSWNTASPRCWCSTTAGSSRRPTTPRKASACARSRTRRSAMRTPPTCRKPRWRARRKPCARSRAGTAATMPSRRAAPMRKLYGDDNPLGTPAFEAKVKLLEADRRLCARQGPARAAGLGQPRRHLAGGGDPARRRLDLSRHPSAGAAQRLGGGRRRRPAGNGQLSASAGARAMSASSRRRPGKARSTRRCARRWSISTRCRRRPARWTWCSAPAGRA